MTEAPQLIPACAQTDAFQTEAACHTQQSENARIVNRERSYFERHKRLVAAALVFCLGGITGVSFAFAAQGAAIQPQFGKFPVPHILTYLFLMLGPFKIIGPFSKITQGADASLTRQIAMWSTLFSVLALLVAAILGEFILSKYRIPIPVLALSAGIILFLIALQAILQQFAPQPTQAAEGSTDSGDTSAVKMALIPLAFPTIVTPYGIAALVVFLALAQDFQDRVIIGIIVVIIMLLNLVVMLITKHIMPLAGVFLLILGAVLGIVQVALGLQIINNSLRALGIL